MFSDHGMGPAGGSGHPWGLPGCSHAVIYGLLNVLLTVTFSVGGLGTFRGQETLLFPTSLIGKPKTSLFQNASILKFAPLKVVWGLCDTEKKLYMCPFGPEPISGTKIPERFLCLSLSIRYQISDIRVGRN